MRIDLWLTCWLAGTCLAISGCGGGSNAESPGASELPAVVTITAAASVNVDTAVTFGSNVTGQTNGVTFHWDFGDGATSTSAMPTHAYTAGGSYSVSLTVTNSAGTTRSGTLSVAASRIGIVQGYICSGASGGGWCWQRPTPVGNNIADVFFFGDSLGWAVGDAGQILKTTDGGVTWIGQRSTVTTRLTKVGFADANNGWAVGETGSKILRTVDGGDHWVEQHSGGPPDFKCGYLYGPGYGYVCGARLRVLSATKAIVAFPTHGAVSTVDGGAHWIGSTVGTRAIITPNGTVWGRSACEILKSSDFGLSFQVSVPCQENIYLVGSPYFADDSRGWAHTANLSLATPRAILWRTINAGASWDVIEPTGLDSHVVDYVKFGTDGWGWLVSSGRVYVTANAGTSWSEISIPSESHHEGVEAVDSNTFWYQSRVDPNFYLTRNRGATWATLRVDSEPGFASRFQMTSNALWLHYDDSSSVSRSYRSVDDGVTWHRRLGADYADTNTTLRATWFFDAKNGLAYTAAGWIAQTGDSGRTWALKSRVPVYDHGPATRLQFVSATTGWVATQDNYFSKTVDGGASWDTQPAAGLGTVLDFHFIDANNGWVVGRGGQVSATLDGGETWTAQFNNLMIYDAMNSVRFASASVGISVGAGGKIYQTADRGATWSARPSGVISNLNRVTFAGASIAWAVGDEGAVTKSSDGGTTWSRVTVPSSAKLNDIFFFDADRGWIVGSAGTMLATIDGGISWQLQANVTDKSLNTVFFADPRTGWVTGEDGVLLVTATGGT